MKMEGRNIQVTACNFINQREPNAIVVTVDTRLDERAIRNVQMLLENQRFGGGKLVDTYIHPGDMALTITFEEDGMY